MDSMIDRFGEKVDTEIVDEKHFQLKAEIADSHVFYAWVSGFSGKVKIEAPKDMKASYKKMLDAAKE